MKADQDQMRRAMDLAQRGRGRTSPNPMVGAVVVKSGRIVGEGFHRRAGGPHAEVVAIKAAGRRARGATLYVNLEPCCHLDKRTPPCVPLIIDCQIRRVVVAMRDPNLRVHGKGIGMLRRAGIRVTEKVLEREAAILNEAYVKYVTTGRPFVISKAAITLDGKISSGKGSTTRITGLAAMSESHRLRHQTDAVLVGIRTVLTDDPRLTARLPGRAGRNPCRIIVDSTLKIPLTARVLIKSSSAKTIIAATRRSRPSKIRALEKAGATVWIIKDHFGRVSLPDLMMECGRNGIASVMIEGGGEMNASAFRSGIVDKLIWFVAPTLMGGENSVSVLEGRLGKYRGRGIRVRDVMITPVGEDMRVEGYL
jgi:diaminohydroxyphosphoribosylaminopyrimidine deaminase / 5-amino-6-(5-phosphoribosylamino)uracil reductase